MSLKGSNNDELTPNCLSDTELSLKGSNNDELTPNCLPAVRYVVEPPDRATGEVGTVPDAPGALVGERRVRSLRAPDGEARTEHGSGLGQTRSVVERSLSGMGNFRRLKLGYERFGEHFPAFHELAACLICVNRIEQLALNSSGF